MPVIYILAGPNGTGKTTYYNTAVELGFISLDLPFINVDNICRDELGGYSAENFARSETIARDRIKRHTDNKESFMIESNLSVKSDYNWLELMRKAGYEISLYFLCTSIIDINIARVKSRVKEGGHDIPEPIIRQRYTNGLMYLKGKLHQLNEVTLIDNSGDTARNVAVVKSGRVIFKDPICPDWAEKLLFITEKLSSKAGF